VNVDGKPFRTVWMEGRQVFLINQPLLPHRFEVVAMPDHECTARAIRDMTVRGAGAIGATGALGMAQALLEAPDDGFHDYVARAASTLQSTRPTAQNLFYGIRQVLDALEAQADDLAAAREAGLAAARAVADDDAESCRKIGENGLALVPDGARVSTHCNAGWLAFVDWGSALSPVYLAHRAGRKVFVWVDETRPRLQGAQLTAWELSQEGVAHSVIADNATGALLAAGRVDVVIVGSDRIAANGDVANKIGTFTSALAARAAGVPFYVAAPTSTIDPACPSGNDIPIEVRDADEIRYIWGWSDEGRFLRVRITPSGSPAYNPAFDVTPHDLVTGILTERGLVAANAEGLASVARLPVR
jgi:methylthioribose-1-phosphate isomerase